ncbi:MAG: hypothetical protein JSU72_19835, partial [Deltaproteobacteria bacterium]
PPKRQGYMLKLASICNLKSAIFSASVLRDVGFAQGRYLRPNRMRFLQTIRAIHKSMLYMRRFSIPFSYKEARTTDEEKDREKHSISVSPVFLQKEGA